MEAAKLNRVCSNCGMSSSLCLLPALYYSCQLCCKTVNSDTRPIQVYKFHCICGLHGALKLYFTFDSLLNMLLGIIIIVL